jgi:hypothetical protein
MDYLKPYSNKQSLKPSPTKPEYSKLFLTDRKYNIKASKF